MSLKEELAELDRRIEEIKRMQADEEALSNEIKAEFQGTLLKDNEMIDFVRRNNVIVLGSPRVFAMWSNAESYYDFMFRNGLNRIIMLHKNMLYAVPCECALEFHQKGAEFFG